LEEIVEALVQKTEITAVGIRHAYHVAPSIREASPTSGGRSVGIVRLRTQTTEFFVLSIYISLPYLNEVAAADKMKPNEFIAVLTVQIVPFI
jgi:hypothetical protein